MNFEDQDLRQQELEHHVAQTARLNDQAVDQLMQVKRLLIDIDVKLSTIRGAAMVTAGCLAALAFIAASAVFSGR